MGLIFKVSQVHNNEIDGELCNCCYKNFDRLTFYNEVVKNPKMDYKVKSFLIDTFENADNKEKWSVCPNCDLQKAIIKSICNFTEYQERYNKMRIEFFKAYPNQKIRHHNLGFCNKYQLRNPFIALINNFSSNFIFYLHFPIYHLNGLLHLLSLTIKQSLNFNRLEFKTDNNKTPKLTYYFINLNAYEIDLSSIKFKIDKIKTYSFQYPTKQKKAITEYVVDKVINYETDYLYDVLKKNKDGIYIYRMKVASIFIFKKPSLPFKDATAFLFLDDKKIRQLLQNDNFLLQIKMDIIKLDDKIYNNKDRLVEYGNDFYFKDFYKTIDLIDPVKDALLDKIFEPKKTTLVPNITTILTNKAIKEFDRLLLTPKEINELLNPTDTKQQLDILPNTKNYLSDNSSCNSSDTDDNDIDDDIDDDNDIVENINDDNRENNNKFEFSYNKNIIFTQFEKTTIQNCIYKKLNENKKMYDLFKPYTSISIIKSFNKTYTNQLYFNIILYNPKDKLLSNQYHIYLDDNYEILSITEINNLI
jgi:hypothetical protein